MQLSIIVPCLNEGAVIAGLLQDLQPLRTAGNEVILVDGGSTDSTLAVATPLVDHVLTVAPGRAAQMNAGAEAAAGNVLWFVHADSRLPPDAADQVLQVLEAGRLWGRFDVRLDSGRWIFRLIEQLMNRRSCLTAVATGDQALFFRRDVFEQVGRFPAIPLMEDIAISKLLRKLGRPACITVPVLTSARRWERDGVMRTILLMWWLRLAYFLGVSPERLAHSYRTCTSPTPAS